MPKKCLSIIICLLLSAVAAAEKITSHAYVSIVKAIEIEQINELNFGQLEQRDGTCIMASGGVLTGVDGQTCDGSQIPGKFSLYGTIGHVVSVSASSTDVDGGVSFTPAIDGESTRVFTAETIDLNIIGSIELNSASLGSKALAYTITANYD